MIRVLGLCSAVWAAILVAGGIGTSPVVGQRVEATVSHDSVTIGQRFALTLTAVHGFDAVPRFPGPSDPDSIFGDLVLGDTLSHGTRMLDSEVRLDSVVYDVTTFELDTALVRALPVSFDDGTIVRRTAPMILPVISTVPQEATDIRDFADPVEFGRPQWPYVLLALALILIGFLIWYVFVRRRAPEIIDHQLADPDVPPQDRVLARLRALKGAPLVTRPQVEAYYVELSDTARTYLEARLDVPALECTTHELILELVGARARYMVPSGVPQQVEQVLGLADLVKFADVTPPTNEGRQALDTTVTIVERIETKLEQMVAREPAANAD